MNTCTWDQPGLVQIFAGDCTLHADATAALMQLKQAQHATHTGPFSSGSPHIILALRHAETGSTCQLQQSDMRHPHNR